jgi:hypothetical protein
MGWALLLLATVVTVRVCQNHAPQSVALETSASGGPPHAR